MRLLTNILLTIIISGIQTAQSNEIDYVVQPKMDKPGKLGFRPNGFYQNYLKNASDNWITQFEKKNPRMMELLSTPEEAVNRHLVSWDGEYAGKLLVGAVEVSRLMDDPKLIQYIDEFISRLQALQSNDGYIGIWPKAYRLSGDAMTADGPTGTCDAWCHYYLMMGLLMWYEDTGDQRSFDMAVKIADLMYDKYFGKPEVLAHHGDPRWNTSAAHGLLLLYKKTNDKRYLNLAKEIVDVVLPMSGLDYMNRALKGKPFRGNPVPHGERWESFPGITAFPELYWITGDRKYADAFAHIWTDITAGDRHNNGGVTSMEHVTGNPYDARAIELCCTVAYMAMSVEMLKLTDDPRIADELEISTMNAGLAFWARSGKWMTYNTVMEGVVVPCAPWEPDCRENPGLYCCTAYAPRGLGILSEWASMRSPEGLTINWYGTGTYAADINGKQVRITLETDYPRTGHIKLKVSCAQPIDFTLRLRIPSWSRYSTIVCDGKTTHPEPGKYAILKNRWKNSDQINLDIDMSLRYWKGEDECAGRASVYKGPVLLALPRKHVSETTDFDSNWKPIINMRETEYYSLMASDVLGSKAVFNFHGDRVTWRFNRFKNGGKADVTIDGKHFGIVDQYAPNDDTDLFAYDKGLKGLFHSENIEYDGLGAGKHRMEITVLADRNPESTGSRITIRELLDEDSDPAINAIRTYSELLPPNDSDGPDVRYAFANTSGKRTILTDYDSASKDEKDFATWLRIEDLPDGISGSSPLDTKSQWKVTSPLFNKKRPDWEIKFTDLNDYVLSVMPGESEKTFYDPIIKKTVKWEQDVYCPTCQIYDNNIYCVYRSFGEDDQWRMGLAWSDDGEHFIRSDQPVFHARPEDTFLGDLRNTDGASISYGDSRLFADENGTYYLLFNYFSVGRHDHQELAIASTRDMKNWTMHGRAFAKTASEDINVIPEKATWRFPHPAVVTRLKDDKLVVTKINGKYWMYLNCGATKGEISICAATSDNMIDWEVLRDSKGKLIHPMPLRPNHFDSYYVDTAAAVLRDDGILLIYNGINSDPLNGGDPRLMRSAHYPGQALFAKDNPVHLLKRSQTPFKGNKTELEQKPMVFWGAPLYESWSLVPYEGNLLLYWNHGFGRRAVGAWKAPIPDNMKNLMNEE